MKLRPTAPRGKSDAPAMEALEHPEGAAEGLQAADEAEAGPEPPHEPRFGRCYDCRFWAGTSDKLLQLANNAYGRCRRFPPVVVQGGQAQPTTQAEDGCGEWRLSDAQPV